MNRVELIGRLCTDPEVRTLSSGHMMARFRLAVKRDRKDSNGEYQSDFLQIVAFNSAENIQKYLHKGSQCAVEGKIQTGSYTNNDGQKVYTTDIIADRVEFLNTRSGQQQNQQPQQDLTFDPTSTDWNEIPDWDAPDWGDH